MPPGASDYWFCCARAYCADSPCDLCGASPPPPWLCARCTLSNPGGSGACALCLTPRPVELDAGEDSPGPPQPQLRPCGKNRDRGPSPDVVEVCADDVDGRDRAPAPNKGKFKTRLGTKKIKIMSYNVWFREDIELRRRMDALGGLIQYHRPDIICFQEVTPDIYQLLQKSDWWQEYKCSLSYEEAMQRQYFCMQLSKLPVKSYDCIPFPNSTMGRELQVATIDPGQMINLVVATSHLESPCPAPPRWDQTNRKERVVQANNSLRILEDLPNVIFCGDMNWDDKGDGPFPLSERWVDAWVELKPGENGWTYDTKANGMLSGNRNLQKRLDRFVCKLPDFKIDGIEMIGKEAIPGVSYYKDKIVRKEVHKLKVPVLPSDHFGLVLTVTHQDEYF